MRERMWTAAVWVSVLLGHVLWTFWLAFLGTLVATPLRGAEGPRAMITRTAGGRVEVHAGGGVQKARPMLTLLEDAWLRAETAENAQVTVVCSNDRVVRLEGEIDWRLTSAGCPTGEDLPPGTWNALEQVGGTLQAVDRGLLVRRRSRGPDVLEGQAALLSPRGRIAGTGRPELVWTAVEDAETYEIVVAGLPSFTLHVEPKDADCRHVDGWLPADPIRLCSIAYPEDQPPLHAGIPAWIRIAVRSPGEASFHSTYDSILVELVADAELRETRWEAIEALSLEPATRFRLRAADALEAGLHDAAAQAYRWSLEVDDDPSTRILYGDVLMAQGLRTYGESQYRKAAAMGGDDVRAAAWERLDQLQANPELAGKTSL